MLILPIKKKWFDMILSGEKKEEYREIKPYYTARFKKMWENSGYWNNYDLYTVIFRNGYSNNSPMFVAEVSLGLGTGLPEWGAEPGKKYYVLRIHNVYREEDKDAGCN